MERPQRSEDERRGHRQAVEDDSCLGAFRQAHHMARDVFLPAGSARVYNSALTAARDAFYPHTPDAPDPPANRPGTARGRRVAQTTLPGRTPP